MIPAKILTTSSKTYNKLLSTKSLKAKAALNGKNKASNIVIADRKIYYRPHNQDSTDLALKQEQTAMISEIVPHAYSQLILYKGDRIIPLTTDDANDLC